MRVVCLSGGWLWKWKPLDDPGTHYPQVIQLLNASFGVLPLPHLRISTPRNADGSDSSLFLPRPKTEYYSLFQIVYFLIFLVNISFYSADTMMVCWGVC